MTNLSQIKRKRMLAFLQKIREEHSDDESLIAINEIATALSEKKYGLVWEQHEERVDFEMHTKVPVFSEITSHEIIADATLPYNFLLEGDNLHSLKLLEKTHKGKIDVIYIDPPYNTGNKDFIYDDSFVDDLDGFKHSKWLSFMNERLIVARNLLSDNGVLVISIGYQEVHNLVLLCQELFDSRQVTCVTVQTSGGKPNGGFNFVQEYLVFVAPTDFSPGAMNFTGGVERSPFEGLTLSTFSKVTRPNQTYPIFIDKKTMNIVGIGKSLAERINDGSYTGELADFGYDYSEAPEGTSALWPISSKGSECVWRLIPTRLKHDWDKGYIKISKNKSKANPNEYSVQYLPEGVIAKIESGELEVIGKEENAPTLIFGKNKTVGSEIPTIWTEKEFHTTKGSALIKEIFGDKRFSYPKPLELITEVLRAVSGPNSIILDFFAGSGTTGQAVLELNKENNGQRKFILCTNSENNICEQVTYPRLKTVITGLREDGSNYSYGIESNLKYYKTDFIPKISEDEDYVLENALLKHIAEMVQLEYAVKLDGSNYVLLLSDDEADTFIADTDKLSNCKAVYISSAVLLTAEQNKTLANRGVAIYVIPDYYFESELLEVGER